MGNYPNCINVTIDIVISCKVQSSSHDDPISEKDNFAEAFQNFLLKKYVAGSDGNPKNFLGNLH